MSIPNSSQEHELQPSLTLQSPDTVSGQPKKKGWVWVLVLIVLAGGGYYLYKSRASAEATATPAAGGARRGAALGPVSVAVASAQKENIPYYLSGLGSVTAFNTVTVKSRVDGQLEKVLFTEGQFVHEGDLLAEIDPRPFQVALEQMQGQLAKDQAQLKDAQLDYARYSELQKQGVIAQQQVDTQTATVGQLDGAIRADQAQIDNEKLQLEYCKIKAPLTGRVGLRLVDQGNMVHATDANGLVVITQVQPIATLFTLPEDNLPDVLKHMKDDQLGVEAYSRDDETKVASGRLLTINNQIDPTTGTVQLKAEFPNSDLSLWPNQFVNIRLMLSVRKDAIVIPLAAIQHGTQGTYVYTVKNGKANLQPVKVDLTQGNISLIASGISEGDQVVVDGQERLQSGAQVETHSATPNGPAGAAGGNSEKSAHAGGPNHGNKAIGGDSASPAGADSGQRDPSKHKKQGKQS